MAHLLTWLTANHTSCATTIYAWFLVGFLGQALFTSRFLVQWFKSEIVGKSVVPLAFWWFSVAGGIVMLAYSVYRMESGSSSQARPAASSYMPAISI